MRKIVAGLYMSLDGVVESPDKWIGPYFSEELGQTVGSLIAAGDTLLLGRVTYEGFASAFAGQSGGVADQMNTMPKVVVSTTLERAEWQNSTLIKGNIVEETTRLKQRPGKNINISGSATLVRWLLREGLLDELNLLVFPIILGSAKRLFESVTDQMPLRLVDLRAFSTGVVQLVYAPAGA
jgi:dihydrofolate reductase